MSNSLDIATIRDRFLDVWDSSVPFVFVNRPNELEPDQMWARFSVIPYADAKRVLGTLKYTARGMAWLQIFVPAGLGDADANALRDTIANGFREWRSPDFRVRFKLPEYANDDSEDNYLRLDMKVEYEAEHTA